MAKKSANAILVVAMLAMAAPITSGCSVGMALSGDDRPSLSAVRPGASRAMVERQLGEPVDSETLDDGRRVDIYEYETGDEPSVWRAVGHGVMDVLTVGIWELAGTPIEASKGKSHRAVVTYDENDTVIEVRKYDGSDDTEEAEQR